MNQEQTGAIIDRGLTDWQILQQTPTGFGVIALEGRWRDNNPGRVEVRLVHEATGTALSNALDWQPAATAADGTWSATLEQIPAGGLYRLETRFRPQGQGPGEWSPRGDMRHFIGVGDLWVIAGQSNSAGYGRGPYHDPAELGVHLFRNNQTWALASHPLNESTDTGHPINREGANPGHSPYLHFGRLLLRQLGFPIGLIQTSLGGSPLSEWEPAEGDNARLYRNMIHCIEQCGNNVRGILWYQGESDTHTEQSATTYNERFRNAVSAWRQGLDNPHLALLTAQLNRHFIPPDAGQDRRWTQVREAQRQAAAGDPQIALVPSFDLPLSDGIHTSPAGNLLLAERLARAALGTVYKHKIDHRAPNITGAHALDGGDTIELHFENVTSRMDTVDPTARPFAVEDHAGTVAIAAVEYPQNHTIHLKLQRPLQGPAQVHGGYGFNPATVPMDMERFIPMLGFYGIAVKTLK